MSSHDRICNACGNKYEYCPKCSKYDGIPKWHVSWDTDECKDVYQYSFGYKNGIYTVDELKNVLAKYNIADSSKFIPQIREIIDAVITTPVAEVEVETPVLTASDMEDVVVATEPIVEAKPLYSNSKKRNKKRNEVVDVELGNNDDGISTL